MRLYSWPLAIMLSADWIPVNSTRSLDALARMGCSDLWADWLGCVIQSLPFQLRLQDIRSCIFCLLLDHCWLSCSIWFIAHHHRPCGSGDLVGQCDSSNLR